jgi:hypothetical protein
MALLQPVRPSAEALEKGYEPVGISFKALMGSLVVLALVIVLFMGIAAWMILTMTRHDRDAEVIPSAVPAVPLNNGLPPLQPSPSHDTTDAEDLVQFRKNEDDVFVQLGWKMGADRKRQVPDDILQAIAAREARNKAGK